MNRIQSELIVNLESWSRTLAIGFLIQRSEAH